MSTCVLESWVPIASSWIPDVGFRTGNFEDHWKHGLRYSSEAFAGELFGRRCKPWQPDLMPTLCLLTHLWQILRSDILTNSNSQMICQRGFF